MKMIPRLFILPKDIDDGAVDVKVRCERLDDTRGRTRSLNYIYMLPTVLGCVVKFYRTLCWQATLGKIFSDSLRNMQGHYGSWQFHLVARTKVD